MRNVSIACGNCGLTYSFRPDLFARSGRRVIYCGVCGTALNVKPVIAAAAAACQRAEEKAQEPTRTGRK